jgi:DNA polymerase-3 subunit gamma/tau
MSLALARKYRPRNFAGVAVQTHVSDTLRGAIERGRVAHGYLLCGPRGTGKTTLARVLAMALNCENKGADGEPCGECISCQRIWSGSSSLDVVEIDAASNRGVDDARELRERAMYAPSGDDRYKVYIVDEAHMLTREAWNALLKILEEPPPRVVFVFATTEPQKIAQSAAPVLSRLQRFDLKRIGVAEITKRLKMVLEAEEVPATDEALAMMARAADGSMRDALSLTDQVISIGEGGITAERVREALGLVPEDEYLGLLDIIARRRAADVFVTVRRLADGGVDFGVFLAGLGDILRAQLEVVLGGSAAGVSPRAIAALESHRDDFSPGDLLRMLSLLSGIEPQFRRSSQQQLLVEMLLVRFALLDRSISLEEVLSTLGGGGNSPAPAKEPGRSRPADSIQPRSASAENQPSGPPPAGTEARTWKAEFDQTANSPERSRLTTEAVRQERLAMMRARDPVLDAAVRELDLDLLD